MSNLQFSHSSAKLRPVKRVQFSVISPEQIVRLFAATQALFGCETRVDGSRLLLRGDLSSFCGVWCRCCGLLDVLVLDAA